MDEMQELDEAASKKDPELPPLVKVTPGPFKKFSSSEFDADKTDSIALLDQFGRRVVDLSLGEMGREVLRAFNGYAGIANALKMIHDEAKPGSSVKLNSIKAASRIVEMAAKDFKEEDLRNQTLEDLEAKQKAKMEILMRAGLLPDVVEAIVTKYEDQRRVEGNPEGAAHPPGSAEPDGAGG